MKKFFGNFFILLTVLLVSLAAVPWNDITQWGQWAASLSVLTTYEMYIKGGIGVLAILFGLTYLFVANREYRNNGYVNRISARAAFFPIYIFAIGITAFGAAINYYMYLVTTNTTNLLILGFFGVVLLTLIVYGHFFADTFRTESNGRRIAHFIFLVEVAAVMTGITFWFFKYKLPGFNYTGFNSYYFILAAGVGILLYLLHLVFTNLHTKKNEEIDALEEEIEEMVDQKTGARHTEERHPDRKAKGHAASKEVLKSADGKKTMIVSNQQTIVSSESNIDPTNMIYEDVAIDPEFTKTTAPANQPNSIEYYIEKPKMFKPLDPTFDELVAYVRELPHVVTKLDDDRITFYIDRKPFLVLMNFGNYYRMAFKYELEKGIRLIIKYPTISKNKSTREELWFKANNYGDIPKDVIYQIVKASYDNVNA